VAVARVMAVEKAVGLEAEAEMAVAANTLKKANNSELGSVKIK